MLILKGCLSCLQNSWRTDSPSAPWRLLFHLKLAPTTADEDSAGIPVYVACCFSLIPLEGFNALKFHCNLSRCGLIYLFYFAENSMHSAICGITAFLNSGKSYSWSFPKFSLRSLFFPSLGTQITKKKIQFFLFVLFYIFHSIIPSLMNFCIVAILFLDLL